MNQQQVPILALLIPLTLSHQFQKNKAMEGPFLKAYLFLYEIPAKGEFAFVRKCTTGDNEHVLIE